jgi:hypothetical protein
MNTLYIITALAITALFPCAIYWLARREDATTESINDQRNDYAGEVELSPHARTIMTLNNYTTEIGKGTLQ